eukprot:3398072-Rhodomonas_salina.1
MCIRDSRDNANWHLVGKQRAKSHVLHVKLDPVLTQSLRHLPIDVLRERKALRGAQRARSAGSLELRRAQVPERQPLRHHTRSADRPVEVIADSILGVLVREKQLLRILQRELGHGGHAPAGAWRAEFRASCSCDRGNIRG